MHNGAWYAIAIIWKANIKVKFKKNVFILFNQYNIMRTVGLIAQIQ